MKREFSILFVSNCFGEDRAASFIASELNSLVEESDLSVKIYGASLISKGLDYKDKNIEVIYSSETPPSGGFPTKSIWGFFIDLFSGSLKNIFSFRKTLSQFKNKIDVLFVVGDVFLLFLTKSILNPKKTIFLALAKSDYFMPHYLIEKNYIRKNVDLMLTRDEYTAKNMQKSNIKALFLGNPLMDGIKPSKSLPIEINNDERIIGILPGSRKEAYKNFELIINIIEKIKYTKLTLLTALSNNLDISIFNDLLQKNNYKINSLESTLAIKENIKIYLLKNFFAEIIDKSEIIIGLAGTANEQAAGIGKPVISFVGSGVQSNNTRMKEQEKLLGGGIKFIKNRKKVVDEITYLLNNKEERIKMGKKGKERMGESGGSKKIAEFILKEVIYGIQ